MRWYHTKNKAFLQDNLYANINDDDILKVVGL